MSSSLTEDNCTKIAIGSHKSDDKSVIPCKNGFRKIDNLICKSEPESENFNDKLLHCKLDTIRTLTETRLHNAITNETSVLFFVIIFCYVFCLFCKNAGIV